MATSLPAEHGIVCSLPDQTFGYFGWPSVARMDGKALVAVASGLRNDHVCPFGRTVMLLSRDEGRTWSSPRVINDSPLDDRDAGIIYLGGNNLLLTWFTIDGRARFAANSPDPDLWNRGYAHITEANVEAFAGSWLRLSSDGGDSWRPPLRVPVSTPHGPVRLANGHLLYLGKEYGRTSDEHVLIDRRVAALRSTDGGATWTEAGAVPIFPGTHPANYHEPHVVELPSGRLIGHIRLQSHSGYDVEPLGLVNFSIMQTESTDGGCTWSEPRPLGFHGSPPHLLRHSSGVLVCSYGYRLAPFGQRVAFSYDDGATWQHDFILRDDGPDADLGYPCSVELDDASIFTVYYQKPAKQTDKCALLWSRWRLP